MWVWRLLPIVAGCYPAQVLLLASLRALVGPLIAEAMSRDREHKGPRALGHSF